MKLIKTLMCATMLVSASYASDEMDAASTPARSHSPVLGVPMTAEASSSVAADDATEAPALVVSMVESADQEEDAADDSQDLFPVTDAVSGETLVSDASLFAEETEEVDNEPAAEAPALVDTTSAHSDSEDEADDAMSDAGSDVAAVEAPVEMEAEADVVEMVESADPSDMSLTADESADLEQSAETAVEADAEVGEMTSPVEVEAVAEEEGVDEDATEFVANVDANSAASDSEMDEVASDAATVDSDSPEAVEADAEVEADVVAEEAVEDAADDADTATDVVAAEDTVSDVETASVASEDATVVAEDAELDVTENAEVAEDAVADEDDAASVASEAEVTTTDVHANDMILAEIKENGLKALLSCPHMAEAAELALNHTVEMLHQAMQLAEYADDIDALMAHLANMRAHAGEATQTDSSVSGDEL